MGILYFPTEHSAFVRFLEGRFENSVKNIVRPQGTSDEEVERFALENTKQIGRAALARLRRDGKYPFDPRGAGA